MLGSRSSIWTCIQSVAPPLTEIAPDAVPDVVIVLSPPINSNPPVIAPLSKRSDHPAGVASAELRKVTSKYIANELLRVVVMLADVWGFPEPVLGVPIAPNGFTVSVFPRVY